MPRPSYHWVPGGLSPGYPEMLAEVLSRSASGQAPKPNQPVVAPSSVGMMIAP